MIKEQEALKSHEGPRSLLLNLATTLNKYFEGEMDRCLLDTFLTMTPRVYSPMFRHSFLCMAMHNPPMP